MLRGACLAYHRDPAAEDAGLVDGIIDLSAAHTVHECEVARNYGFVIMVRLCHISRDFIIILYHMRIFS